MPGWQHVQAAVDVLSAAVDDLFALPGAAQKRAVAERERLGDDHGDDLLCGCWKAHTTATALLELGGRHIDAIIHLSGIHPGFVPSAQVLARAGLEALLRVCWLVKPAAPAEREQRWVALQREEARLFAAVPPQKESTARLAELDQIAQVIGGPRVPGTPSIEVLAKEFGRTPMLYDFFYRWNSQPVHATAVGAGYFNLDNRAQWQASGGSGEWIEAEFWAVPLLACWEALIIAVPAYRDLLAPSQPLPALSREREFITRLRAVPPNTRAYG